MLEDMSERIVKCVRQNVRRCVLRFTGQVLVGRFYKTNNFAIKNAELVLYHSM